MICPFPAWDHALGDRLTDVEHGVQIGPHELAPRLGRKILERRAALDAGVVDEHVNRSDLLFDRGDAAFDTLGIGHVENGHVRREPLVLESRHRGPDLAWITSVDHDARARFSQTARQRKADPTGRAGDQRNDIVKREQLPNIVPHPEFLSRPARYRISSRIVERPLDLDNVRLQSYHRPRNTRPTSRVANRKGRIHARRRRLCREGP